MNSLPSAFFDSRRNLRFAISTGSANPSPLSQVKALRSPPPCTASGFPSRIDPISAQDRTNNNSSPPLRPFHSPRLTPVLYAESTATRKNQRNVLRLFPRNKNGRPPSAPLRKNRLVGSVVRGKLWFRRQTLPQAEPIAAEITAVMVIIRFEIVFTDEIG